MSDLNLNEGQEFYAGGKRFVIRGGVPVQEEKRGPLGGELVRFNQLEDGDIFYIKCTRSNWGSAKTLTDDQCVLSFNVLGDLPVEINVPQPQAKWRVMTAGEAARLPDIVGKRVLLTVDEVDEGDVAPLTFSGGFSWMGADDKIEVLD